MTWVYEFEALAGNRFMKRFLCATTFCHEDAAWWCNRSKRFVADGEPLPDGGRNNSPPIRSFKAFKRFLRKHPELRGADVTLVNRYVGYDVKATWQDDHGDGA